MNPSLSATPFLYIIELLTLFNIIFLLNTSYVSGIGLKPYNLLHNDAIFIVCIPI